MKADGRIYLRDFKGGVLEVSFDLGKTWEKTKLDKPPTK